MKNWLLFVLKPESAISSSPCVRETERERMCVCVCVLSAMKNWLLIVLNLLSIDSSPTLSSPVLWSIYD